MDDDVPGDFWSGGMDEATPADPKTTPLLADIYTTPDSDSSSGAAQFRGEDDSSALVRPGIMAAADVDGEEEMLQQWPLSVWLLHALLYCRCSRKYERQRSSSISGRRATKEGGGWCTGRLKTSCQSRLKSWSIF